MSKLIKLTDNVYFDSSSIMHNKQLLKEVLNNIIKIKKFTMPSFSADGDSANGSTINVKEAGYKPLGIIQLDTHSSALRVYQWTITNEIANVYGRNTFNYKLTFSDIEIVVLYIKE